MKKKNNNVESKEREMTKKIIYKYMYKDAVHYYSNILHYFIIKLIRGLYTDVIHTQSNLIGSYI